MTGAYGQIKEFAWTEEQGELFKEIEELETAAARETSTPPLTVCLRILEGLGKPGEYVWRYSKEIPGLEQRMAYLRDAIAWLRVKAGETIWRELPVDFRTFTESAQLLNKKGVLWPRVIECGSEINSGKYVEAVLTGGIGVAKALALDTPIPTPTGWSSMGALQVGDKVLDESGKACSVVAAHPVRYNCPCYEVEFSDGSIIVADAEHNWFTQTRSDRRQCRSGAVRTTQEIRATLKHKTARQAMTNHSVRVAAAIEGKPIRTYVDPYVFGAWLGDGDSNSGRMTSADPELMQLIAEHYAVKHKGGYATPCSVCVRSSPTGVS